MTAKQTPLVDLLRVHADDIHSAHGHNKSSTLLSRAADRIDALEAERDRLLYSERLHNEALGTAVQEAELLRAERAQLRAELAELFDDIRRATNREIARGTETNRLRAELASWQEAFGLLTTLHGSIQIDSSDPMGMAKQVESHVRAENTDLLTDLDRVLTTLRYLIGIAERGEGRPMTGEESAESFVLGYVKRLEAELERERMRLAVCGVVALANTPESAARARDIHPDYRSASCDDVARAVDSEMSLRAELAELRKPDCFRCAYWFACRTLIKDDCGGGDKFVPKRDPVRLYEEK